MDEEQQGGFVLFGGGFSALVSIGALILALNNPTVQDLQTEAASIIQQEAANTNPLLALMSEEIGRAGADALTIRSTNYVVFTHFEVTTPDASLFGGGPPRQLCFIGVMNEFYPCEAITDGATQATSANTPNPQAFAESLDVEPVRAGEPSARAVHLGKGFTDYSNEPIDRRKGWVCDGIRVTFASIGDALVDAEGNPSEFGQGIVYQPYTVSIAGKQSTWLLGQSNCGRSCNQDNPAHQYLVPLHNSSFRDAEFSILFGVNFNNRPCEPVR